MMVTDLEVILLVDFYDFDDYNYLIAHLEKFKITIESACTSSNIHTAAIATCPTEVNAECGT